MTEKESAMRVIESLPETTTTREIMYQLYVRTVLQRSAAQHEAGQTIPQEEIEKEISQWLRA